MTANNARSAEIIQIDCRVGKIGRPEVTISAVWPDCC